MQYSKSKQLHFSSVSLPSPVYFFPPLKTEWQRTRKHSKWVPQSKWMKTPRLSVDVHRHEILLIRKLQHCKPFKHYNPINVLLVLREKIDNKVFEGCRIASEGINYNKIKKNGKKQWWLKKKTLWGKTLVSLMMCLTVFFQERIFEQKYDFQTKIPKRKKRKEAPLHFYQSQLKVNSVNI